MYYAYTYQNGQKYASYQRETYLIYAIYILVYGGIFKIENASSFLLSCS